MKKIFFLTFAALFITLTFIFNFIHFEKIDLYIKSKLKDSITFNDSSEFFFNPITLNFYTEKADITIGDYRIKCSSLSVSYIFKTINISDFKVENKSDASPVNLSDEFCNEISLIFLKLKNYNLILRNGNESGSKFRYDEINIYNETKPKIGIKGSYDKNIAFDIFLIFAKDVSKNTIQLETITAKSDLFNLKYENKDKIKISFSGKSFGDFINIFENDIQFDKLSNNQFGLDFILDKSSKDLDGNGRLLFNNDTNNAIIIKTTKIDDKFKIDLSAEEIKFKDNNSSIKSNEFIPDIIQTIANNIYKSYFFEVNFDAKNILYDDKKIENAKLSFTSSKDGILFNQLDLKIENNYHLKIDNNVFEFLIPFSEQNLTNLIFDNLTKYLNIGKDQTIKITGNINSSNNLITYENIDLFLDNNKIFHFNNIDKNSIDIALENVKIEDFLNLDLIEQSIFTESTEKTQEAKIGMSKVIYQIVSFFDRDISISGKNIPYKDKTFNDFSLNLKHDKDAQNKINISSHIQTDNSVDLDGSLDFNDTNSTIFLKINSDAINLDNFQEAVNKIYTIRIKSFDSCNGSLKINIKNLYIGDEAIQDFSLNTAIEDGIFSSNGTSDKINFNMNANLKNVPVLSISTSYNSISLNSVIKPICARFEGYLSGIFNGTANINLTGSTLKELIDNVTVNGHMIIQNLKLKGMQITDMNHNLLYTDPLKMETDSLFADQTRPFKTIDGYYKIENKNLSGYLNLEDKSLTGNFTYSYDLPSKVITESKGIFVMSAIDLKSKKKDRMNIFIPFAFNGQCSIDESSKFESKIDTDNLTKYFDYIKKK